MLNTTASHLLCPRRTKGNSRCDGTLSLTARETLRDGATSSQVFEVRSGHLDCRKCRASYPILAGVAIVVEDVRFYLLSHVKGIAQVVPESEIPEEFIEEFLEAKDEIEVEHIEEDLEAERVTALYLMNHYLRVGASESAEQTLGDARKPWWQPRNGEASPLIDSLVRQYWDHGPFAQISRWISELAQNGSAGSVVELGCGVGGLYPELKSKIRAYLGVDSSFASIALARHLTLGVPYQGKIRIPEDLLQGPVSRDAKIPVPSSYDGQADFIIGDIENPPLQKGRWDVSIALNAIDMLDVPSKLPELQCALIKSGGVAIQSCPYIWHEVVARKLRSMLPRGVRESARAVEWLYERAGFKIEKKVEHLPWLFFKHVRQLEIYSVHLFVARKSA